MEDVKQRDDLIYLLKVRFEQNLHRHLNLDWNNIEKKLIQSPKKLQILNEMERTSGEPDVRRYFA